MVFHGAIRIWLATAALGGFASRAAANEASRLHQLREACAAAGLDAASGGAFDRVLTVEGDDGGAVHVEADGRLVVDFAAPISAEEGHVRLDGGGARAAVTVGAGAAAAILKARAEGKLVARIGFHLAEQEGMAGPCTIVGGGDFMRVRAAPIWVDLAVGGRSLARALTDEGALEPAAGAIARVDVSATVEGAVGADADRMLAATRELRQPALACYRLAAAAGKERPAGTLALALEVAASGSVADVKVLIDGVRDPSLSRCVVKAARALRFAKGARGAQVTASVVMELAPAK